MTTNSVTSIKTALITGAGSGIGRATAIALAKEGYSLALAGRRLDALRETESLVAAANVSGVAPLVVSTDVTEPASVRALFETIERTLGRLDLLFNNAGTNTTATPLDELSFEQWRQVIDVNITGPFLCAREAFRLMKRQTPQGGRIINNGSVSAHLPRPNSVPYTTSKHAITGLTRATALDGRQHNIACGQIDIGNAETDMAAKQKKGVLQANGQIASEATMAVENVAKAVVYMASLPLDANVLFMTVMATQMPFVGRG